MIWTASAGPPLDDRRGYAGRGTRSHLISTRMHGRRATPGRGTVEIEVGDMAGAPVLARTDLEVAPHGR